MVKYKHSGVGGQFTTMLSLVHIQVCRHCMADEGGRVQKNFVQKKILVPKNIVVEKCFVSGHFKTFLFLFLTPPPAILKPNGGEHGCAPDLALL